MLSFHSEVDFRAREVIANVRKKLKPVKKKKKVN